MNNRHYSYIDALRGYAILAVIATHSFPLGSGLSGIYRKIVDQGARGVELFFLVSALTLTMSWHAKSDGALNFYIRRLFRIVPMFWLGLIFYAYPEYWSFSHFQAKPVLSTILFLNGWKPDLFNAVVPGGWSIAVEMNFYLIFPFLAYYCLNFLRAFIGVCVSLIFAYWTFVMANSYRQLLWPKLLPGIGDDAVWMLVNLWLPSELPIFFMGISLYFWLKCDYSYFSKWLYEVVILIAIIGLYLLAIKRDPWTIFNGYMSIYSAYGFLFALVTFSLARGGGVYLVNPLIVGLGKISFSAYLWHFTVVKHASFLLDASVNMPILHEDWHRLIYYFFYYGFIVLITSGLSFITYSMIEKPMIHLGNHLIKRLS